MKHTKFIGISLISTIFLGGIGVTSVSAVEIAEQTKETPTTVIIKDSGEDPDVKPGTDSLTLDTVPSAYNFETTLKNKDYSIDGVLTNQNITVFNNTTARGWSVKATVKDNQIMKGQQSYAVTNFKVNDVTILGTGATGIVAKSTENKTAINNTGYINTAVTKASIGFSDTSKTLKIGDTLTGTISYQLYNTENAK